MINTRVVAGVEAVFAIDVVVGVARPFDLAELIQCRAALLKRLGDPDGIEIHL